MKHLKLLFLISSLISSLHSNELSNSQDSIFSSKERSFIFLWIPLIDLTKSQRRDKLIPYPSTKGREKRWTKDATRRVTDTANSESFRWKGCFCNFVFRHSFIRAVKSRNQRNSWLVFAFEEERRAAIVNDFSSRLYHDTHGIDIETIIRSFFASGTTWCVCVCVFVTVGHERFSEPSCPSNCSDDVLVSRDRQNERETS